MVQANWEAGRRRIAARVMNRVWALFNELHFQQIHFSHGIRTGFLHRGHPLLFHMWLRFLFEAASQYY